MVCKRICRPSQFQAQLDFIDYANFVTLLKVFTRFLLNFVFAMEDQIFQRYESRQNEDGSSKWDIKLRNNSFSQSKIARIHNYFRQKHAQTHPNYLNFITQTNRNTLKLIQITINLNIYAHSIAVKILTKYYSCGRLSKDSSSSLITFFHPWKIHFFRIYIIEIWRETIHLVQSSRYQSAVRGIGFCTFFLFFFFFPRFEIGFHSMQTSPLSFSEARKFFLLYIVYIVGHKSCLNVTLRERLSECAQFLTHPSALQE